MGYFSEKRIGSQDKYLDRSYHGFDEQLQWRYETNLVSDSRCSIKNKRRSI